MKSIVELVIINDHLVISGISNTQQYFNDIWKKSLRKWRRRRLKRRSKNDLLISYYMDIYLYFLIIILIEF